jgi:F-type H+-transporting ATPase subunit b
MLIDWFTVAAQALNFLILVWLMGRFLYRPVLDAIDAREKRIATQIADANAKKAEAEREKLEFEHKNSDFDRQRAVLLSQVIEGAQAERHRLVEEAREAAETLSARRRDALKSEMNALSDAISRRTQQEVFGIARRTLTDLSATSLEQSIAALFIRRLRDLDGAAKAKLAAALKTSSAPVLIRCAFELPSEQRLAIQQAVNESLSGEFPLTFQVSPEVIAGIELSANGRMLAWSIAGYLVELESAANELMASAVKSRQWVDLGADPKPPLKAT